MGTEVFEPRLKNYERLKLVQKLEDWYEIKKLMLSWNVDSKVKKIDAKV